jgi:hypothetical protein
MPVSLLTMFPEMEQVQGVAFTRNPVTNIIWHLDLKNMFAFSFPRLPSPLSAVFLSYNRWETYSRCDSAVLLTE